MVIEQLLTIPIADENIISCRGDNFAWSLPLNLNHLFIDVTLDLHHLFSWKTVLFMIFEKNKIVGAVFSEKLL